MNEDIDTLYKRINTRIRKLMYQEGYSLAEMSNAIGLEYHHFNNKLCLRKSRFNLYEIVKLCSELCISVDELCSNKPLANVD